MARASAPLVSFVIPVYNVEAWLPACVDSLLGQDFEAWEALFVNDGSTDRSPEILADYAQRDARIKVIHQENKGIGASRNAGCERVQGRYIFFLDSDDMIVSSAVSKMVAMAEANQLDLVISDFRGFVDGDVLNPSLPYVSGTYFDKIAKEHTGTLTFRRFEHDFDFLWTGIYTCVAWGKLFRTEVWKKLDCYVPGNLRIAEDFIPVKKFIFNCQSLAFYNGVSVLYRTRKNSASRTRKPYAVQVFQAYPNAFAMMQESGLMKDHAADVYRFFLQMFLGHLVFFAPYWSWPSFYKQMAGILQTWKVDGLPVDLQRTIQFHRRGWWIGMVWEGMHQLVWERRVKVFLRKQLMRIRSCVRAMIS